MIFVKPHLHERLFCVRFFDKNGSAKLHLLNGGFYHDIWDLTDENNCLKLVSYQYCYN